MKRESDVEKREGGSGERVQQVCVPGVVEAWICSRGGRGQLTLGCQQPASLERCSQAMGSP